MPSIVSRRNSCTFAIVKKLGIKNIFFIAPICCPLAKRFVFAAARTVFNVVTLNCKETHNAK